MKQQSSDGVILVHWVNFQVTMLLYSEVMWKCITQGLCTPKQGKTNRWTDRKTYNLQTILLFKLRTYEFKVDNLDMCKDLFFPKIYPSVIHYWWKTYSFASLLVVICNDKSDDSCKNFLKSALRLTMTNKFYISNRLLNTYRIFRWFTVIFVATFFSPI